MRIELLNKILLNFSPSFHRLFLIYFMPLFISTSASFNYIESYVSANFIFILLSAGINFYLLKSHDKSTFNSLFLLSIPGVLLAYVFIGPIGSFFFAYFHYYQMVRSECFNQNLNLLKQVLIDFYYFSLLSLLFLDFIWVDIIVVLCIIPVLPLLSFQRGQMRVVLANIRSILIYGVTGFLTAAAPFMAIFAISTKVEQVFLVFLTQSAVFVSLFLLVLRYFSINYLSTKGGYEIRLSAYISMRNKCVIFFFLSLCAFPFYYLITQYVYGYSFTKQYMVFSGLFYISTALSILSFPFSMLAIKESFETENLKLNAGFFTAIFAICLINNQFSTALFFVCYTSICFLRAIFSIGMGNRNAFN